MDPRLATQVMLRSQKDQATWEAVQTAETQLVSAYATKSTSADLNAAWQNLKTTQAARSAWTINEAKNHHPERSTQ